MKEYMSQQLSNKTQSALHVSVPLLEHLRFQFFASGPEERQLLQIGILSTSSYCIIRFFFICKLKKTSEQKKTKCKQWICLQAVVTYVRLTEVLLMMIVSS